MGIFSRKPKIEERAELTTVDANGVMVSSILGTTSVSKTEALNIPAVQGCVNFAANTVSMLPIKLYKEVAGEVEEVKDDIRVRLLNDDTGDTLDSAQFWRALIEDYYLGKGGYAYINKNRNKVVSLHYVDESQVSINNNNDQIFKSYEILVNSKNYKPYDFVKILRNTKDGAQGTGINEKNSLILSTTYNSLVYEETLVKTGGNKRGFLKSTKTLTKAVIDSLRTAFRNLYSNNSENIIVLNDGIDFTEASNTSVEMQLNENKKSNSAEICKLFGFSTGVTDGTGSAQEYKNAFKTGIIPLLKSIECALNRDLLLEKEKTGEEVFYFAFDTKEMLKGDIKERFDAYKVGIDSNFLGIDEARYMEDLEPLGIEWIKLGLDSVLFNPKTGELYTPNTNQTQQIDDLQKGGE